MVVISGAYDSSVTPTPDCVMIFHCCVTCVGDSLWCLPCTLLTRAQVSAFSTWEKELPKFCFDKRYLLLSTKERRAAFEDFIRERADEERREKKNKLKEVKEGFRALLVEAKLTPK